MSIASRTIAALSGAALMMAATASSHGAGCSTINRSQSFEADGVWFYTPGTVDLKAGDVISLTVEGAGATETLLSVGRIVIDHPGLPFAGSYTVPADISTFLVASSAGLAPTTRGTATITCAPAKR